MKLTLGDLKDMVDEYEEMPDETEIRFASQPSWPFEYSINSQIELIEGEEREDGEPVIYLAEKKQLSYLNKEVKDRLGW